MLLSLSLISNSFSFKNTASFVILCPMANSSTSPFCLHLWDKERKQVSWVFTISPTLVPLSSNSLTMLAFTLFHFCHPLVTCLLAYPRAFQTLWAPHRVYFLPCKAFSPCCVPLFMSNITNHLVTSSRNILKLFPLLHTLFAIHHCVLSVLSPLLF